MLLDTHVLVWMMQEPDKIGARALAAMEQQEARDHLSVSAISCWEIAMLACKGKLTLGMPTDQWLAQAVSAIDASITPLELKIAADAGCLPGPMHGDPADCLIVATARAFRWQLLTADEKILAYAAAGHVKAIDARR